MSISLDHTKAKNILLEATAAARTESLSSTATEWKTRVARLGELCPHGKSSTVIAALGTAILAKATDDRVDVYSLLDRGEAEASYSARSLADNVWARNRAELGIDIGANGANPLNNTPFIGKTRIDDISGVRNKLGWEAFLDCMKALEHIGTSSEAKEALRGFIAARSRSLLTSIEIEPAEGDGLTQGGLIALVDRFVSEDSEGGRRAQAVVAGLLDAAYGPDSVVVGVINDPDRRAPLDVSVSDGTGSHLVAFEVKDKPIYSSHMRSSIEKTAQQHSCRNLAFVAVGKNQTDDGFDDVIQWASHHGVKLTIFTDWTTLYCACKWVSPVSNDVFEGRVFRSLLARAAELGVASKALDVLRKAAMGQDIA